jgi:hypothetical protein
VLPAVVAVHAGVDGMLLHVMRAAFGRKQIAVVPVQEMVALWSTGLALLAHA